MTKIKLLSISVIGLLLINIGIIAFLFLSKPLHPRVGQGPIEKEGPKKRIIEILHFDKEQIEKYEKLIDQHGVTITHFDEQIRSTKNELYQTLKDKNSTSSDSLIHELATLQEEIEDAHYNHFIEIRGLCRSDQLDYFNSLTDELARFFAREDGNPPPKGR